MATNPGDGPSFNGRPPLKGFPYNSQDAAPNVNEPPNQQPASASKGVKATFKKIFGILDKPKVPEGAEVIIDERRNVNWRYPGYLYAPHPNNIHEIMHTSPEHLAVLERQEREAAKSGHVQVIQRGPPDSGHVQVIQQGDDTLISSPATDNRFLFEGNSMITYRDPNQIHPDYQVQNAISPETTGMGNQLLNSANPPTVWSNVTVVDASEPSFPGGNQYQMVHRSRSQRSLPQSRPIDMSLLRSPYEIAEAAYVYGREGSKGEWIVYLEGYRAGQFNIMKPPKPPLMDALFSFLPALDPLNEQGRLSSLFTISRVWTPWQEDRSMELVKAAREEFGVPGVSISLIDNSNEILKAEVGYNRRMIKRSVSIAAHALLTTEVLVILDTQKDWRFAKNPLVVGEPRIRFFAGAPILSKNCEVIGMFVIFGREPRDSFSALQRRSLTDYGAVCASDLNTVMEKPVSERSLHSLQSQANTENWDPSYFEGETKPKSRDLWMHEETHRMLCGEPKEDEDTVKYPTTFAELMERVAAESTDDDTAQYPEKKPQQSFLYEAISSSAANYPEKKPQQSFLYGAITDSEKKPQQSLISGAISSSAYSSIDVNVGTPAKERDAVVSDPVDPVVSDYPLLGSDNEGPDSPLGRRSGRSESPVSDESVWRSESPTSQGLGLGPESYPAMPRSPIVRSCTPRPYSGSDLTSVDGNLHPNTPTEHELSGPPSSGRVQDVLDHVASVLQPDTPAAVTYRRQRKDSIRSISKYEAELLKKKIEAGIREAHVKATDIAGSGSTALTERLNTSGQQSTVATTPPSSSFNTHMSTLEFASTNKSAEANAAAMSVAKKLGFDKVYVAELAPSNDLLTPEGVAVSGVGVRILASYNCPADMILDTDIHLQVLRSSDGALRWHDKDALPGVTNKSLLIRLHSKGPYGVPRSQHTGGMIYAAIQVAPLEGGENNGFTDEEQTALVDAANEMKFILFKKNDKRERIDSSCTNCNASVHADNHHSPAPVVQSGFERSLPAPTMQTPTTDYAESSHSSPFGFEDTEHPNSISMETVQEATEAVAKMMKVNMEDEMSPQW